MLHLRRSASVVPPLSVLNPVMGDQLAFAGAVMIPAIAKRFFVWQPSMQNCCPGPEFEKLFYDTVEEPTDEVTLNYYDVQARTTAYQLIGELEIPEKRPTTIGQTSILMEQARNASGEACLLTNGYGNVFFCLDGSGRLCLVTAWLISEKSKDLKWGFAARRDMHKMVIGKGCRVFSASV